MKIEDSMIDKDLRIPGMIFRKIMKTSSKEQLRKMQKLFNRMHGKKIRGLICSEELISRKKDNTALRLRIYKPLVGSQIRSGLLWMHGGGYAIGIPEASSAIIKKIVLECNCIVVSPDYRLSVDYPYPAALDDCHEALVWMKDHAQELGIRENQLMVGGESAGGGLAASLALYERDHKGVPLAFQIPLYPMIDDRMITASSKDNDAPVWNSTINRLAWDMYLSNLKDKDVPIYASPSRATDYSKLPPAVTFVGDLEPFRDETIEYVENLRKEGIPVEFEVFPSCYHAFDVIPFSAVSKKARAFLLKSLQYAVEHYFVPQ